MYFYPYTSVKNYFYASIFLSLCWCKNILGYCKKIIYTSIFLSVYWCKKLHWDTFIPILVYYTKRGTDLVVRTFWSGQTWRRMMSGGYCAIGTFPAYSAHQNRLHQSFLIFAHFLRNTPKMNRK